MAELPRLLICTFDVVPSPSGMSRRLSEYLSAVEERYQAVVLSVKTPDHSHIEKFRGARLLRVPVGSGDLAARIQAFDRAVRRQLESEEYALAHFTDPFGGYALCETRADYGHKLIYEAEAFPSQELKFTTPQVSSDRKFLNKIRRQELFCLMNAERVITGSAFTKNFIQSLGVPAENVRVLRPPVDLAPYRTEILGQPDGKPMRALYLGNSASWQGLQTLLQAVKLSAKQVELFVTIVGPRTPEQQVELEEKIDELGLKSSVELQYGAPLDDVFKVVLASDIGLLPLDGGDRNAVQGGALAKVADYLAGGRPVLASDLPIAREVVPEAAGVFVEPDDAEALAAELVSLAKDPARRVKLGKAARAAAEERHDAAKIRRQLLDLYLELSGGGVRPEAKASSSEAASTPTLIGTGVKKPDGRRKKKAGEPKTDPAIRQKKAEEPTTDPNRVEASPPLVMGVPMREPTEERTDRAEPVLGKPPPSLTPESFVGPLPISPLLTGGATKSVENGVEGSGLRAETTPAPIAEPAKSGAKGGKVEIKGLPPLPQPPPSVLSRSGTAAPSAGSGSTAGAQDAAPRSAVTAGSSDSGSRAALGAAGSSSRAAAAGSLETAPRSGATPGSSDAGARAAAPVSSPISSTFPSISPTPPSSASDKSALGGPAASAQSGAPPSPGSAPSTNGPALATSPATAAASSVRASPPIGGTPAPRKAPLIGGGKRPAISDEPAEISADEVMDADEAEDASHLAEPADDDAEHVSDDEISEADDDAAEPVSDEEISEVEEPAESLAANPPALTPRPSVPLSAAPPGSTPRPLPIPAPARIPTPRPIQAAQPSGSTPSGGIPVFSPDEAEVVSKLDPWYAQLVHGYCPPEGASFARHTPPTNFPGRDQAPPATAAPAGTLRPKAEK